VFVGQISKIYEFKNYISNLYPVLKKNKKYTLVAIGYDGQGGFEKKNTPWPPLVLVARGLFKKMPPYHQLYWLQAVDCAVRRWISFFTYQPSLTFSKIKKVPQSF
jgi:hypothetical protein